MSILDNFVYEKIRPVQRNVLLEVDEALKSYDFLICECPTGTGKSGIIATTALTLGSSYVCTASKLLQKQYINDFHWMKQIVGRNNFKCVDPIDENYRLVQIDSLRAQKRLDKAGQDKIERQIAEIMNMSKTCSEGDCVIKSSYNCPVKPKGEYYVADGYGTLQEVIHRPEAPMYEDEEVEWCRYFEQKHIGLTAGHTVMNYKYFFSLFFHSRDDLMGKELLAFDEAHSIENEIIDFIGITLSRKHYEGYEKDFLQDADLIKGAMINVEDLKFPKDNVEEIETWIAYLDKQRKWMASAVKWLKQKYEGVGLKKEVKVAAVSNLSNMYERIEQIVSNIILDKENWVIDVKFENFDKTMIKDVKLYPIEAGRYIKPVFDTAKKKMFVSATLFDRDTFAKMIGINPEAIKFIRIKESPFPVANRQILAFNLGEMNYQTMPTMLPQIASNIDAIMENHSDEKGIIHTTSYTQCDHIAKNLSAINRKRLLVTGGYGVSQEDILRQHGESDNTVLLSPSLHQGVDLKDDLSRFQVIVKIPYPDISDKRTKIKMTRDYKWYLWQTLLRLVQAYGRSIRNEEDRAVTYVLDSKIKKFLTNRMLPEYVREAIVLR